MAYSARPTVVTCTSSATSTPTTTTKSVEYGRNVPGIESVASGR